MLKNESNKVKSGEPILDLDEVIGGPNGAAGQPTIIREATGKAEANGAATAITDVEEMTITALMAMDSASAEYLRAFKEASKTLGISQTWLENNLKERRSRAEDEDEDEAQPLNSLDGLAGRRAERPRFGRLYKSLVAVQAVRRWLRRRCGRRPPRRRSLSFSTS